MSGFASRVVPSCNYTTQRGPAARCSSDSEASGAPAMRGGIGVPTSRISLAGFKRPSPRTSSIGRATIAKPDMTHISTGIAATQASQMIEAIERVSAARQPVLPHPYLKEGQRARITGGPLTGVEGILVESRPDQGLLVLSLHLLHRSIAVVIDGTAVVPA